MHRESLNNIGRILLDSAITVHRIPGRGLLESAYHLAMIRELSLRGLHVLSQYPVDLNYKDVSLGKWYVINILVEDSVVIEIKSVESMLPVFQSQLITYLKLSGKNLGYLINFNALLIKDGFQRIVYNF